MTEYRITFELAGKRLRTKVKASSEYNARKMLIAKNAKIIIIECKEINPFMEAESIMDFLKGFGK